MTTEPITGCPTVGEIDTSGPVCAGAYPSMYLSPNDLLTQIHKQMPA
jgi:hypothetical protein